ncbi:hypothetical protein T4D_12322 [Trichinella pseudospiralis]|uniref:Uncharacterized protein n=1 Tax=Trichinella pseudospiralis TaxID=6337 RepID=A0A0V1FDC9_TRIPS|nr:hypothetical protein T4D_12322 [Trichinella pseudospiralis]
MISIKGALSSVTVHLYKEWNKQKVKTQRTTRSRTSENKAKKKRKRGRHEANLDGHLEEKEMRRGTKTGFERCTMQITIAITGALSSVTVHLFASLWWQQEKGLMH